jgi:hypothetical protein
MSSHLFTVYGTGTTAGNYRYLLEKINNKIKWRREVYSNTVLKKLFQ